MKTYSKSTNKKIMVDELFWARFVQAGISREDAQQLCGVSAATWRRWETGQSRIPKAAYELIRVTAAGHLAPVAGQQWREWRFIKGKLVAPNGWEFSPGELMSIPHLHSLARRAGDDEYLRLVANF